MAKQVTITLTDTVVNTVNEVLKHRREDNFNSLLVALVEQAANNMLYRYDRNKSKWVEAKQNKQKLAQLEEQVKAFVSREAEGDKGSKTVTS